jgi:hypothetical protein
MLRQPRNILNELFELNEAYLFATSQFFQTSEEE